MQRAIHTLIGKRTALSLANCEFSAVGGELLIIATAGESAIAISNLTVSSLCDLFDLCVRLSAKSHPHIDWEENSAQPGKQ